MPCQTRKSSRWGPKPKMVWKERVRVLKGKAPKAFRARAAYQTNCTVPVTKEKECVWGVGYMARVFESTIQHFDFASAAHQKAEIWRWQERKYHKTHFLYSDLPEDSPSSCDPSRAPSTCQFEQSSSCFWQEQIINQCVDLPAPL